MAKIKQTQKLEAALFSAADKLRKEVYMLMIPLSIACIPEYIFDLNAFFSQVIVIGVFYLGK